MGVVFLCNGLAQRSPIHIPRSLSHQMPHHCLCLWSAIRQSIVSTLCIFKENTYEHGATCGSEDDPRTRVCNVNNHGAYSKISTLLTKFSQTAWKKLDRALFHQPPEAILCKMAHFLLFLWHQFVSFFQTRLTLANLFIHDSFLKRNILFAYLSEIFPAYRMMGVTWLWKQCVLFLELVWSILSIGSP